MKSLILLLTVSVIALPSFAQPQGPRLVKDMNTRPADYHLNGGDGKAFVAVGDYVSFPIDKGGLTSLWITDGTPEGTHEVDPATKTNTFMWMAADLNGKLMYLAFSEGHSQLKKYDPATGQSSVVKEFNRLITFSTIRSGDQLIFALPGDELLEIWTSDGTEAGTVKIKTIEERVTLMKTASDNDTYTYFTMGLWDYPFSHTLYRTDGTADGTIPVIDAAGLFDPYVRELFVTGNDAYIGLTRTEPNGGEFWKSDGTVAGTIKLTDTFNQPKEWATAKVGSKVMFTDGGTIFVSDGTVAGTQQIFPPANVDFATEYNGMYYFISLGAPWSLGKSDGTQGGTSLVMELGNYEPFLTTLWYNFDNKLVLSLEAEGMGSEFALSDGTEAGTKIVKDINAGEGKSSISHWTPFGDKMLLLADDGVHGKEIWVTDGTESGTNLLIDTHPGTSNSQEFYQGEFNIVPIGDHVAYRTGWSNIEQKDELWVTDGTEQGTQFIEDVGFYFRYIGSLNGDAYYLKDLAVMKLSASDHSWTVVRDFRDDGAETQGGWTWIRRSIVVNNKLLFSFEITDGDSEVVTGQEWYVTDGTENGTRLLKDINPGPEGSNTNLQEWGGIIWDNKFYFNADDGVNGNELWVTDGTSAGTKLVADIHPGPDDSTPSFFFELNNKLFFAAFDTDQLAFWTSDGTAAGTTRALTINPNSNYQSFINTAIKFKGIIYFSIKNGDGSQLWRSDGTVNGTKLVKTISQSMANDHYISRMVATQDYFFFAAKSDEYGFEVWKSDGTTNETVVLDITPGPAGTVVSNDGLPLKVINEVVYFTGDGSLWRTAGSVALSEIVWDGPIMSLQNLNDQVYFVPMSEEYGTELYVTDFTKFNQEVDFDQLGDKTEEIIFNLIASATSERPVVFTASPANRVVITETSVMALKPGRVAFTAKQSGNDGIEPAEATQSICIFPRKPVITLKQDKGSSKILESSAPDGNIWRLGGNPIPGATAKTFEATEDGVYTVSVKIDDCPGPLAEAMEVFITGLEDELSVSVYPNPAKDKLYVEWKGNMVNLSVLDTRGIQRTKTSFTDKTELNTGDLAAGIYLLKLQTEGKQVIRKFVKE